MAHSARLLTLAILVVAIAMGAACSDTGPSAGSVGRGVNVQLAWRAARFTTGHRVHVAKEHVKCTKCHELTDDKMGAVSPARCASCHEKEARLQHAEAQAAERFGHAAKADCTLCHAFAEPAGPIEALSSGGRGATTVPSHDAFAPADCVRCHATAQGTIPAVAVHGTSDCLGCHRPHEDATPKPGPCVTCHDKIATEHASLGKSPQAVCTTCHQHQHAPASEALGTCVTCHATTRPIVPASALFEGGHRACVGCHRPHEFTKQAAAPCRSCHADVHVLAETRVAAHSQCTSCHAPHDVRGSPQQACARCHSSVHPDHPKLGLAGTCVGCHDPHPAWSHARESARACSSCHQTAHADKDFHEGVACTQCHKPHGFALASAGTSTCRTCHASEVSRVEQPGGHEQCASCHKGLPHRPKTLLAGCATCHGAQQHEVNSGHQQCTKCHEPHAGALTTTCASCHEPEAHSAPAGHAKCLSCHQPHSGSTQKVTCAGCHAPEAGSAHGQIAGGCANCHRPHGPKGVAAAPVCTTCHKPASLLGLHQEAKHQICSKCHTGHGDQPGLAREACLSCHTDRKAHFPDAPRCAGCHLFDTPRASPK